MVQGIIQRGDNEGSRLALGKLMNPNEDFDLRVRIRDYILPLIDRHLREK